jgi:hypothetical protein
VTPRRVASGCGQDWWQPTMARQEILQWLDAGCPVRSDWQVRSPVVIVRNA